MAIVRYRSTGEPYLSNEWGFEEVETALYRVMADGELPYTTVLTEDEKREVLETVADQTDRSEGVKWDHFEGAIKDLIAARKVVPEALSTPLPDEVVEPFFEYEIPEDAILEFREMEERLPAAYTEMENLVADFKEQVATNSRLSQLKLDLGRWFGQRVEEMQEILNRPEFCTNLHGKPALRRADVQDLMDLRIQWENARDRVDNVFTCPSEQVEDFHISELCDESDFTQLLRNVHADSEEHLQLLPTVFVIQEQGSHGAFGEGLIGPDYLLRGEEE